MNVERPLAVICKRFSRCFYVICFLIVITLFLVPEIEAQEIEHDGIKIVAMPDITGTGYYGYTFSRIIVSNNSLRDRQIRIFYKGGSGSIREISRRFSIAAGETRRETLYFPIMNFHSSKMQVEIDGKTIPQDLPKSLRVNKLRSDSLQALVDSRISRAEFNSAFKSYFKSYAENRHKITGVKFDGDLVYSSIHMNQFDGSENQLYKKWLGYSKFGFLIFYSSTIEKFSEEVKRAIFDYVRVGGTLICIGKLALPADFYSVNTLNIKGCNLEIYTGNFGRVILTGHNFLSVVGKEGLLMWPIYSEVLEIFHDLSRFSVAPFIKMEKLETETVSSRWLISLIILFSILVGPVNCWILHRIGRKILVFITVPVASTICCIAIYAYYLVFEKDIFIMKIQSVSILNENINRSATFANFATYSATADRLLKFDDNTEFFPYPINRFRNKSYKSINLDNGQHFTTGWIIAKTAEYFHLRNIQMSREQINISVKDDETYLLNGLGTDIKSIIFVSESGKVFEAFAIKAGKNAVCRQIDTVDVSASYIEVRDILGGNWTKSLSELKYSARIFLKPGMYMAEVAKTPFFDFPINEASSFKEEAYIIGIMKKDESL